MEKIREVNIKKDKDKKFKRVHIIFGPHYFIDLFEDGGKITFILGATHHGFKADASEVGGELEKFINEIRNKNPQNAVD